MVSAAAAWRMAVAGWDCGGGGGGHLPTMDPHLSDQTLLKIAHVTRMEGVTARALGRVLEE